MNKKPPVIHRKKLSDTDIIGLIHGDIACIRIPQYFSHNQYAVDRILQNPELGSFGIAKKVKRLGMAHIEVTNKQDNAIYHDKAHYHTQLSRQVFLPYLSPVDKLRLELDEIWPYGAHLKSIDGRKCFSGICRVLPESIEVKPHVDRLDRDIPGVADANTVISQISACVYLQTPNQGGELMLWMKEPEQQDKQPKKGEDIYGTDDDIGEPMYRLLPEVGELLLFNIRKYHGVAAGKGKQRINTGIFIGYEGSEKPLTFWS